MFCGYQTKARCFLPISDRMHLTPWKFCYKIKKEKFFAIRPMARENRSALCSHLRKMRNTHRLPFMRFWLSPHLQRCFYVFWISSLWLKHSARSFLRYLPSPMDLWLHIWAILLCVFMNEPYYPLKKQSETCAFCAERFPLF